MNSSKVIVFDLGGTLMQYVGMPYSWVDYYYQGFEAINQKYNCGMPKEKIHKSVQKLREYNPRVNYREIEYSAESIFEQALEAWKLNISLEDCVRTFWGGLQLNAEIFEDTVEVVSKLREKGYVIAALTDLPNAMPDKIFKQDIGGLLVYIDCYISSEIAGFRKPNCKGLQMISERYGVPMKDIIFVGDEEKDRNTAENAKCGFIKISRENVKEEGINNLYQLLELLALKD